MTPRESSILNGVSDDVLARFIRDGVPYRTLQVHVSRADERRLRRVVAALNAAIGPDDQLDPACDGDLAVVFAGCANRGLQAGEDEDGVWTDVSGHNFPLPRRARAPRWMRLRFTVRAAVTTWRSS